MLSFEDVMCVQAELEDVNKVYRSDAPVRLGPEKLPCMSYCFVVKRKSGMEIYLALYARDIKRGLIYRVDGQTKGIGDPSTQIKKSLTLLKELNFSLDPINLKFGAAMLEVVLKDVPVIMTPAKAKKTQMERASTIKAWENQAAYLVDHSLLDADENTLAKMAREDRNRYNTAVTAYQKLEEEDHFDEQRELLFEHVDALLHGRTPPKPGSLNHITPAQQPVMPPDSKPPESKPPAAPVKKAPQEQKPVPVAVKGDETPKAEPPEKNSAIKTVTKIVNDPKDKQRIQDLEKELTDFRDQLRAIEDKFSKLEAINAELKSDLKQTQHELDQRTDQEERTKDLEAELEAAHHEVDEAQREIRSLKSDNAKHRRKIEELEEQQTHDSQYNDAPAPQRSRLKTGRLLSSASASAPSVEESPNAPHILRKPPPAGATFGVDWDLEHMPCSSLKQIVELHKSICNAQLTLEGYSTQYCSAFIIIVNENGGRQLYMVFHLNQENRFLIYKPVKKPTSTSDISRLLKEAQRFLQVCGVDTERVTIDKDQELPSGELKKLFANI